ncbi:MAG: PfkB family carbohydrate kinase [Candidatus Shapirobacteria bacterium]|nr:PfkB family carbohydrate kinase [Candidatus Shapirobacteria bacterium]
MSKKYIVISGSIAIDRIMNFSNHYKDLIKPDKIHVLSISIFLDKLKNTHGGVGANIAYSLGLLGEKPILIGSVGPDAKEYIQKLNKIGVNTDSIFFSQLPTASFNVITDLDDNQIGGFYPGAMFDNQKSSFKDWKNKNAFFVISPDDPKLMDRLTDECQKYKLKMLYDFGQQVTNSSSEFLEKGIKTAEVIIANDYEMSVLSEKIKLTLDQIKKIVPICITTLGAKGSIIEGKNIKNPINIKPVKPKKILDPTGAGDAFRSGFLYGYIRNLDLKICGQIGSLLATYAIETYGTQEHHFTKNEFVKRFHKNYNQTLVI